jgi:hypothetical protein
MQWPDHVRSMADINLGLRNEALKITDRDHGFMQTRTGETHKTESYLVLGLACSRKVQMMPVTA